MPITPKHAFKEKSTKLLILLHLRTIYNRTFQCETPCSIPACKILKMLQCDSKKSEVEVEYYVFDYM